MHSIVSKNVVVTGKIAGESRVSAEQKLRDAGANVQSSVTSRTDLLVCGVDVGQTKLGAAAKHGAEIVTWQAVQALLDGRPLPSGAPRTRAQVATLPSYRQVAPMLCEDADALPVSQAGWQFEIKWDGHRSIATIGVGGRVALASRQGNDQTQRFSHVAAEVAKFPSCVLDGELVAIDAAGNSQLQDLGDDTARYMLFDLLELQGRDLRGHTLAERRDLLEELVATYLPVSPRIGLSPVFSDGEQLLGFAREQGLEGIVCKMRDSTYREGARPTTWRKLKLRREQEFVVVGFTQGKGARAATAGALLLAVNDEDGLVYCGSVGTGGSDAQWTRLIRALETVKRAEPPLERHGQRPAELASITWVEPELVVQVAFQKWTRDGRLWHPSLQGVRDDKSAGEVVRELVVA